MGDGRMPQDELRLQIRDFVKRTEHRSLAGFFGALFQIKRRFYQGKTFGGV